MHRVLRPLPRKDANRMAKRLASLQNLVRPFPDIQSRSIQHHNLSHARPTLLCHNAIDPIDVN
jgi:hypothetical protein